MDIEKEAVEVIAAYKEHQAMLLIGGHSPKRVDAAIADLQESLVNARRAQIQVVE